MKRAKGIWKGNHWTLSVFPFLYFFCVRVCKIFILSWHRKTAAPYFIGIANKIGLKPKYCVHITKKFIQKRWQSISPQYILLASPLSLFSRQDVRILTGIGSSCTLTKLFWHWYYILTRIAFSISLQNCLVIDAGDEVWTEVRNTIYHCDPKTLQDTLLVTIAGHWRPSAYNHDAMHTCQSLNTSPLKSNLFKF